MLNNHDDNIIYMCIQIRVGGIWGGEGARGNQKSTCFINKQCALSLYRQAIDSVLSDGEDF